MKSIQPTTDNKTNQPNKTNQYPCHPVIIHTIQIYKISVSSPKPVKYTFPSQCIPQPLPAYAMHVWLMYIQLSDIPAIHPPSIRRAYISPTGSSQATCIPWREGKTIHDRMACECMANDVPDQEWNDTEIGLFWKG